MWNFCVKKAPGIPSSGAFAVVDGTGLEFFSLILPK